MIHGLYGCGVDQRPAWYFKDKGYCKKVSYFLLVFYPDYDDWRCVAYSNSLSYIFRIAKKYLKMNFSVKISDDRKIYLNDFKIKAAYGICRTDHYKDFFIGVKKYEEKKKT